MPMPHPLKRPLSEPSIIKETESYALSAFSNSAFFSALRGGPVRRAELEHVFLQYGIFRRQLCTWYGLCIAKSGTDTGAIQEDIVGFLARQVSAEIEGTPERAFQSLLSGLSLTEDEVRNTKASKATVIYSACFCERFGATSANFESAVIALAGVEFLACVRTPLLRNALTPYGLQNNPWLTLPTDKNRSHFHTIVRPFLLHEEQGIRQRGRVIGLVKEQINRHVGYWDELFEEARNQNRPLSRQQGLSLQNTVTDLAVQTFTMEAATGLLAR